LNTNWQYYLYKNFWVGIDWLFPPVCGGCGRSGTRWCQDCQKKVQVIDEPVCNACGLPQTHSGLCERCEEKLPSFKLLRSWTVFEEPVRKALHRLKYRRDIGLGEALSNQMSGFVAQLGWSVDTLIPIPLGKRRLKERGYNQVAMVAMPLSIQLGLDYDPAALARARETRSQVGLSAVERQENVQGAFFVDGMKVSGRSVLLIDDVSTTGATLSSAAEALLTSGAREVYAVTIARALPHHGLKIV
jgi:competence protein ComFC